MEDFAAALLLLNEIETDQNIYNLLNVLHSFSIVHASITMMLMLHSYSSIGSNERLYSSWINNYLQHDFYFHFRMTRITFYKLYNMIGPLQVSHHKGGNLPVGLEKALLMVLWHLAKGEVLISVSERFDVALATVHKMRKIILGYLLSCKDNIITWPNNKEADTVAKQFLDIGSYPDVIGAIDGCHIHIKPPSDQQDSYLNRKFRYAIVLQGVCSARKLFTNVFIGIPGSAHDARVLSESSLMRKVLRDGPNSLFYGQYHLLGDSAYPCRTWLMTPYRDTGHLTELQRHHNGALSRSRVAIENAFGLLKGRWRITNCINVYSIQRAVQIAAACCILHNFCLLNSDFFDMEPANEEIDDNDDANLKEPSTDEQGDAKRHMIADYLHSRSPASKRRR